jgi:hypothetical protein
VILPQYLIQHGYYTVAAGKIFHTHFPDPESWDAYSPDGVIRYVDGTEELYDHENDPFEWTNLAANVTYIGVKKDLARWLPKSYTKDSPHEYFSGDKKKGEAEIDKE